MPIDYAALAATATRLADENGKGTAWIRSTPVTSTDPAAGTVTLGTPVDVPCNAIQIKHDERYTPGALIETGDLFWFVDAWPGVDDILKAGDDLYNIIEVWPVKPGDTLIGARVQTRGGVPAPDLTDAQIALDEYGNSITLTTTDVLDVDGNTITVT